MAQRPTRSRAATRPLETLTGVITAWSRPDPSAAWEVERHWRIQAIQGKGQIHLLQLAHRRQVRHEKHTPTGRLQELLG